jgi:hypothetical protein
MDLLDVSVYSLLKSHNLHLLKIHIQLFKKNQNYQPILNNFTKILQLPYFA